MDYCFRYYASFYAIFVLIPADSARGMRHPITETEDLRPNLALRPPAVFDSASPLPRKALCNDQSVKDSVLQWSENVCLPK